MRRRTFLGNKPPQVFPKYSEYMGLNVGQLRKAIDDLHNPRPHIHANIHTQDKSFRLAFLQVELAHAIFRERMQ